MTWKYQCKKNVNFFTHELNYSNVKTVCNFKEKEKN